ncbi:MAG: hypothetical protein QOE70_5041 [Chthoniobacter sp.]|jgi:type II secretory pathway pseudopilin PulG|nr:hypothetical protein [Chthoniobacter sp.]
MSRTSPRFRGAGFTFVEILAALAFLGILIPVVISALMVANRAGLVAERTATAVQLGENQLNEMMLGGAWSSGASRGDFGPDRPGYRWQLEKGDWESSEMTELTLAVYFQVQGQEHDVQLSTLVNEALTQ